MKTVFITFEAEVPDSKIESPADVCLFFDWLNDILKQHGTKLVKFKVSDKPDITISEKL